VSRSAPFSVLDAKNQACLGLSANGSEGLQYGWVLRQLYCRVETAGDVGELRVNIFSCQFGKLEGSATNQEQIDSGQPAAGWCEKLGPKLGGCYRLAAS